MTFQTMMVFDPVLWGGKDVGDNSQFWKEAEILRVYMRPPDPEWQPPGDHPDELADVRFLHDDRISRGHLTRGMSLRMGMDDDD